MSTETQQEYRELDPGEILQEGDERNQYGGDKWTRLSGVFARAQLDGVRYRRPIKPEPPMKSGYMFEQAKAATRCHQCGNPIGLGYRTNNEGQQFCGERCAESSRKGEAMLASALERIEKLKTYITEREQSWRMSSVCREKAKTIEYLTGLSEERLQEIERLKSEADGWPDKRHENQAAEIERLKASLAECERLRAEAVQSEARAMAKVAVMEATHQATNCAGCGEYKHTPWRSEIGYICAHCLTTEADKERDRLAAENAKLLSLIKDCASHFEDLSSVSWSVGSEEGRIRIAAVLVTLAHESAGRG